MPIPDSLTEKLTLFRSQGLVVREADELFTEPGWVQVLIGQNVLPGSWHPLADGLSEHDVRDFMSLVATSYDRAVQAMPDHGQWLAQRAA
jgi:tryptophan halogenase